MFERLLNHLHPVLAEPVPKLSPRWCKLPLSALFGTLLLHLVPSVSISKGNHFARCCQLRTLVTKHLCGVAPPGCEMVIGEKEGCSRVVVCNLCVQSTCCLADEHHRVHLHVSPFVHHRLAVHWAKKVQAYSCEGFTTNISALLR